MISDLTNRNCFFHKVAGVNGIKVNLVGQLCLRLEHWRVNSRLTANTSSRLTNMLRFFSSSIWINAVEAVVNKPDHVQHSTKISKEAAQRHLNELSLMNSSNAMISGTIHKYILIPFMYVCFSCPTVCRTTVAQAVNCSKRLSEWPFSVHRSQGFYPEPNYQQRCTSQKLTVLWLNWLIGLDKAVSLSKSVFLKSSQRGWERRKPINI